MNPGRTASAELFNRSSYDNAAILLNVGSDGPDERHLMLQTVSVQHPVVYRDVSDAHGKRWRVREMEMAGSDDIAPRKSLIAVNEMVIRRFWSFPPDWRNLSDRALLALIDGPAQPRPETSQEAH